MYTWRPRTFSPSCGGAGAFPCETAENPHLASTHPNGDFSVSKALDTSRGKGLAKLLSHFLCQRQVGSAGKDDHVRVVFQAPRQTPARHHGGSCCSCSSTKGIPLGPSASSSGRWHVACRHCDGRGCQAPQRLDCSRQHGDAEGVKLNHATRAVWAGKAQSVQGWAGCSQGVGSVSIIALGGGRGRKRHSTATSAWPAQLVLAELPPAAACPTCG